MTEQLLYQSKNEDSDFHIKYKIRKQPIGKGSFSTVYLGTDKQNKLVAIKQISLSKIKSSYMDKFLRELDISMKLDHPNIVKCYEVFKTENHWYIVNEYCDCGTLQDLSSDLSKHSHQQREYIVRKLLNELKEALKYLISNNIIHRDLKPSNILIKKISVNNYSVKLADFGFARYFSNEISDEGHDDMVSTICGSPIYMAPELLIDLKYNMKADLWSFGVIMYELLYGVNPYFFPKNIPELRKLMVEKEITYPDIFSRDCIDLLKSLLVIDPMKRLNWKNFFQHQWFTNLKSSIRINPDTSIDNISKSCKIKDIGGSTNVDVRKDLDNTSKVDNDKDNIASKSSSDILTKLIPTEVNSSINKPNLVRSKNIDIKPKPSDQNHDDLFEDILLSAYIDPKYKEDTLSDFDFELINIDDVDDQVPEYKTYHESSTNSLIKILSNSIRSLWNYGSPPSNNSSPYGTPSSYGSYGKSPPSYGRSPPSHGSSYGSSYGRSPPINNGFYYGTSPAKK